MSIQSPSNPITISHLNGMKTRGEKIVCLTAYDATFSAIESLNGVEVILVGDSLGMILQGHDSTLPVTMEDIIETLLGREIMDETDTVKDMQVLAKTKEKISKKNSI